MKVRTAKNIFLVKVNLKKPNRTNLHSKLNKLFSSENIKAVGYTSDTDRTMYQNSPLPIIK
jgi:hypothetical protein